MINTVHIKARRFDGLFHVGDPASGEVVLMMGSCRGVPHINFLNTYNEAKGRPLSIYYVDPFDYNWDRDNNFTDLTAATAAAVADPRVRDILERTTIFIHEHFGRFGPLNTDKTAEDNIYRHGLDPRLDICLPNFHDRFILFQNIVDFDEEIRVRAREEGRFSRVLAHYCELKGADAMESFVAMCQLTSFPEFGPYFMENCKRVRMFHNHNHVSHHFTIPLFRMMSEKFLHLDVDQAFYDGLFASPDIYANANVCPLTQHDVDAHGWMWPEPLSELKI